MAGNQGFNAPKDGQQGFQRGTLGKNAPSASNLPDGVKPKDFPKNGSVSMHDALQAWQEYTSQQSNTFYAYQDKQWNAIELRHYLLNESGEFDDDEREDYAGDSIEDIVEYVALKNGFEEDQSTVPQLISRPGKNRVEEAPESKEQLQDRLLNLSNKEDLTQEEFEEIIAGGDTSVVENLAGNETLTGKQYKFLAGDRAWQVRAMLADNYNVPKKIQNALAVDEDYRVRSAAAYSNGQDPKLFKLFQKDTNEDVRIELASNPRLSSHQLKILAEDPSPSVRAGVLDSGETTLAVLRRLTKDADENVQKIAKAKLRRY